MIRWRLAPLLVVLALLIAAGGEEPRPVVIEHNAAAATTRYYDPNHRPEQMPPPSPDEAGLTVSQFNCVADVKGRIFWQSDGGPPFRAIVQVQSVRLQLHLTVSEWIMQGAPEKILAHENGHRRIAEIFYASGDEQARAIGRELLGREFSGGGTSVEDAAAAAMNAAAAEAARQYMSRVRDPSENVQELYDQITNHGGNAIDEDQAIATAMEEANRAEDSDHAAENQ